MNQKYASKHYKIQHMTMVNGLSRFRELKVDRLKFLFRFCIYKC